MFVRNRFANERSSPATGCPGAGSEFKVDDWIVMNLLNRSGQAVDHPRLVSPRFLQVGDHGVMHEGIHGT